MNNEIPAEVREALVSELKAFAFLASTVSDHSMFLELVDARIKAMQATVFQPLIEAARSDTRAETLNEVFDDVSGAELEDERVWVAFDIMQLVEWRQWPVQIRRRKTELLRQTHRIRESE